MRGPGTALGIELSVADAVDEGSIWIPELWELAAIPGTATRPFRV